MDTLKNLPYPELELRGVLRLQMKNDDAVKYIKSCRSNFRKAIKKDRLQCVTVFVLGDQIFLYYESNVPFEISDYLPEISEYVYMWPGQSELRPYVSMVKYFQSVPMEAVPDWKEARKGRKPYLSISRMKLDKLSSYIFYHYALQEEQPGSNGRYVAIWGNEEWCVLYGIKNSWDKYESEYVGKLDSKNVPEKWRDTMVPHFNRWPVSDRIYRQGKIILNVE